MGDVIFGRYRANGYDAIPKPGVQVFADVRVLLAADVVIGNLETPLVRELPEESPIGSDFRFGASFEHACELSGAGFTALSVANNHWFDQRLKGIEETPVLLRELGMVALGSPRASGPVFRIETIEKNGWSVGFIAATTRANVPVTPALPQLPFTLSGALAETLAPVISEGRAAHDLIVVFVHWGHEYADHPDRSQVVAAHALIDSGADLVIGHHPHVLQGIERYGRGVIAYSLGNFLFDNTHSNQRLTGVLRVEAVNGGVSRVMLRPAFIRATPVAHPVPAIGRMAADVRQRVIVLSKTWGTRWQLEGDDLRLVLE